MPIQTQNRNDRLYLIGSGTPTPMPGRFGSCLVLGIGDEKLMFDCGPATTYKLRQAGMNPTQISHLFFTHHHYDHNVDYPCFLLCRWDHEKDGVQKLKVYGPPPTERITQGLMGPEGVFYDDWKARVDHPASREVFADRGGCLPRPEPVFDIHEIQAGERISIGSITVTTGRAVHLEPMMDSLSYRIDWKNYSVAISGDTARNEDFEHLAKDADMLVVNVWDHQENMSAALTSGFCGTMDAAIMATSAGVSCLVIAHQGAGLCLPGSREKAVADISTVFKGEIIFGEELMTLELDGR